MFLSYKLFLIFFGTKLGMAFDAEVMNYTAQKMKFSIKDFLSKCDQISGFLRIWSHLLKKSLMEKFIFCAVLAIFEKLIFNVWHNQNVRMST